MQGRDGEKGAARRDNWGTTHTRPRTEWGKEEATEGRTRPLGEGRECNVSCVGVRYNIGPR